MRKVLYVYDVLKYCLCATAGHQFGTLNKSGYILLVFGLILPIVSVAFIVGLQILDKSDERTIQRCLPSRLEPHKVKLYSCRIGFIVVVILVLLGTILAFVSLVPRSKTCGKLCNNTVKYIYTLLHVYSITKLLIFVL